MDLADFVVSDPCLSGGQSGEEWKSAGGSGVGVGLRVREQQGMPSLEAKVIRVETHTRACPTCPLCSLGN